MITAFNGHSTNPNPELAGLEAAKMAGHAKGAKLVFVYTSCDYNVKKVIAGIKKVYSCPIIGNTSFTGVITPSGFITGEKGFVGIMVLTGTLKVGIAGIAKTKGANAIEMGEKVAQKALKNLGKAPTAMYMVASPTEEEYFLKGITNVVGRIPFFGGSCADNTIEGKWKLFTDNLVMPEGVAVAFINTDSKINNVFTGAYHETKDMGIVTKMNGHRNIVEIDGKPALKVYAKWRGMTTNKLLGGNLLSESIVSPLGVKDRLGDLVAIRHPMNGNEDLTINVGNKVAEGTCIIRMEASVNEIISSVSATLKKLNKQLKGKPAFYHLVHCGGRRAGIGDRINEVTKAVAKLLKGVPYIMEFTFGEYGYEQDGRNTCGGLMLSFTAFEN